VEELDILWRREMVAGSYDPKWLPTHTDAGTVHAITFVINRNRDC
jgi:cation transport protein ChaC